MKWKKHFECFWLTFGLVTEDEARQVSALLYYMGDQAESVVQTYQDVWIW